MQFSDFPLDERLLRGVADLGFVEPTPIQEDAIPPAIEGRDVLGAAMTGSGKTAAYLLPTLHRLLAKPRGTTRALVLAPTRELAQQVEQALTGFAAHTDLTSAVIHGGVAYEPQERAFRKGVDVLIATPGRLLDHLRRPYAGLEEVEVLILDEADRMLDMGFIPDVRKILGQLPAERQTLLFSATMPGPIVALSRELLHDPATINVERKAMPATGITQAVYPVRHDRKFALFHHLLVHGGIGSALAFVRTKERADHLATYLEKRGVSVAAIHGDRSQIQRTKALEAFRRGEYQALVATDVAARGLDLVDLTHVVNIDVPAQPEDYIHRVGRTARYEAKGDAFTFVAARELADLHLIEKVIGTKLPRLYAEGFDYRPEAERIEAARAEAPAEVAEAVAVEAADAVAVAAGEPMLVAAGGGVMASVESAPERAPQTPPRTGPEPVRREPDRQPEPARREPDPDPEPARREPDPQPGPERRDPERRQASRRRAGGRATAPADAESEAEPLAAAAEAGEAGDQEPAAAAAPGDDAAEPARTPRRRRSRTRRGGADADAESESESGAEAAAARSGEAGEAGADADSDEPADDGRAAAAAGEAADTTADADADAESDADASEPSDKSEGGGKRRRRRRGRRRGGAAAEAAQETEAAAGDAGAAADAAAESDAESDAEDDERQPAAAAASAGAAERSGRPDPASGKIVERLPARAPKRTGKPRAGSMKPWWETPTRESEEAAGGAVSAAEAVAAAGEPWEAWDEIEEEEIVVPPDVTHHGRIERELAERKSGRGRRGKPARRAGSEQPGRERGGAEQGGRRRRRGRGRGGEDRDRRGGRQEQQRGDRGPRRDGERGGPRRDAGHSPQPEPARPRQAPAPERTAAAADPRVARFVALRTERSENDRLTAGAPPWPAGFETGAAAPAGRGSRDGGAPEAAETAAAGRRSESRRGSDRRPERAAAPAASASAAIDPVVARFQELRAGRPTDRLVGPLPAAAGADVPSGAASGEERQEGDRGRRGRRRSRGRGRRGRRGRGRS